MSESRFLSGVHSGTLILASATRTPLNFSKKSTVCKSLRAQAQNTLFFVLFFIRVCLRNPHFSYTFHHILNIFYCNYSKRKQKIFMKKKLNVDKKECWKERRSFASEFERERVLYFKRWVWPGLHPFFLLMSVSAFAILKSALMLWWFHGSLKCLKHEKNVYSYIREVSPKFDSSCSLLRAKELNQIYIPMT